MIKLLNLNVRRQESSDGGLIIEGSANNVDTVDSYRTRFRFTDNCIAASRGHIILWNHDTDAPIGRNLEMSMRGSDLWVRDEIDAEAVTPYGRSIPDLVRKGIVNGLSIRFDNEAEIEFGREADTVIPNHISEHSIVTLPSNRGSTMSEYMRSVLRNLENTDDGAEIARVFRIGFAADHGRTVAEPEPRQTPLDFCQRDIGPLSFQTLSDRLHEILGRGDYDYYAYPVAIYEDAVVYSVRGRLYRRSFTVDAAGEVTLLDDETEVLMKFEDANSTVTPTRSEGEAPTSVVTADVTPAADLPTVETTPPVETPPAGDEPVAGMTLDELREALAAELPDEPPAEPEDEAVSLEELEQRLTLDTEPAF